MFEVPFGVKLKFLSIDQLIILKIDFFLFIPNRTLMLTTTNEASPMLLSLLRAEPADFSATFTVYDVAAGGFLNGFVAARANYGVIQNPLEIFVICHLII